MSHGTHNPDRSTWYRRCPIGCASWPDTLDFQKCLRCGDTTKRYSGGTPMDLDEALSLLRRAKFNAYYSARCERLHIPVAGPLPDWYEPDTSLIGASP